MPQRTPHPRRSLPGCTRSACSAVKAAKRWIIETTELRDAFFDFDQHGWLDIFQVNGSLLEPLPKGQEPTNHLYQNNPDGVFTDVTEKAV